MFCGNKYAGEKMPEVPWKLLRDNPTDVRSGWNFLQDQRTRMPVDGQTWLFDRIGRDDDIRRRFLRPGSESGVNKEGIRAYMRQVVKFQEKLLILMHITGKFRSHFWFQYVYFGAIAAIHAHVCKHSSIQKGASWMCSPDRPLCCAQAEV